MLEWNSNSMKILTIISSFFEGSVFQLTENHKKDIRIRSNVYDSMVKSPNRAMLRATGMGDEEFKKPIIGVISTWAENTPCNIHLHDLGKLAKKGIQTAGGWRV